MLNGFRIALVEDDEIMGHSLVHRLELEGAEVIWMKQVARAIGALRTPRAPIDAVVCDIRLPDGDGEDLFNRLLETTTPPPFLFITGHGGVEQAVRLMQAGASDYITKPFEMAVFLERLSLLLNASGDHALPPLVGISQAARRVEEMAERAARIDRAVLIRGGPGTGKELVARRIHEQSDRRAAPFVVVNLAREADAQAALFGPDGAVERTGEGILFLQALSRMPGLAQQSLAEAMTAGFAGRIIAASGHDMDKVVQAGAFDADLFYRLDMVELPIPPLSARPEDAVWLMEHLFGRLNAGRDRPLKGISRLAEQAVRIHDWPGGGREVRARLVHALETAQGEMLQPADLFPERIASDDRILTLAEAREQAERRQIVAALERTGGQVGQAARLLKVSRTTLWEKMQKLGVSGTSD